MKDFDLVSIVMPTKNSAMFLRDCLDSILKQTERNWELLAVDDNSSDDSADILHTLANKESRIKVFNNQGNGIIPALQTGYSQSTGNFITRMDSDDLMAPTKIETLKNSLLKSGAGHLATGLVQYFSNETLGAGYKKYAEWINHLSKEGTNFLEIYKECVIPSPCWMLWRTDFIKCGAFDSLIYPEDYDLCFRFYESKLKVLRASEVLHFWRDYATRTSRTDPNYANNNFLNLKLNNFLKLDYNSDKSLILWGAGKKGKTLAQILIDQKIEFTWITNNSKKAGLKIFGKILTEQALFDSSKAQQCIIAVANEIEQEELKHLLANQESYFFC